MCKRLIPHCSFPVQYSHDDLLSNGDLYFQTWENNKKMEHEETRHNGMNWISLAQHRKQWQTLVYMAMNYLVP